MSLEWTEVRLKDVGKIVTGKTPKTSIENNYGGNIPFLTPSDDMNVKIIQHTSKTLTLKGLNEVKNCLLPKNSVCVSCIGSDLGKVVLTSEDTVTNQQINSIIVNENFDYNFVYYVMILLGKQLNYISKSSTAVPIINKSTFSNELILVPPLEEQKKISAILSNIDSKIANLNKINKNLDNLLMSIFNSWFINFEVYDKSNGMKFDETFGDVPRLWSVEMLEDYVDFVTGVEPGSKNYHEKPEINDIPFIRVGDLGSRINTVFIDKSLSKNKILSPDDITLSLDATVGIVKMGLNGAYSTGMRKLLIKNDDINKPFLYCLVKSKRIQRIIETFATGTTILHAGKSIKHMNFVLSDEQTMNQFGKIGNPILSIILANLKEINKLTKLRDTLLPKLMSGEIDVSKINCDLKIIIRKIYIKSSKVFLWRYLSENKNHIKNTKSNETLLKSRTIHKINKFLAKFNARYRHYRQ